jgi:hypothetical protein
MRITRDAVCTEAHIPNRRIRAATHRFHGDRNYTNHPRAGKANSFGYCLTEP